MQISERFAAAVHLLCYIHSNSRLERVTSETAAESVGVNPVVVRNIMRQLRKNRLITVDRTSGILLAKQAKKISLYDVYRAVEAVDPDGLFRFPASPSEQCEIGKVIRPVLGKKLSAAQKAMEKELKSVSLEDLQKDIRKTVRRAEETAG